MWKLFLMCNNDILYSNVLLSTYKFPFPGAARHTESGNWWEPHQRVVRRQTDKAPQKSRSIEVFIL